jgi:hypothetical protein
VRRRVGAWSAAVGSGEEEVNAERSRSTMTGRNDSEMGRRTAAEREAWGTATES